MELLKRYKELKAQGVSITLMELKKQMESSGVNEVNNISSSGSDISKVNDSSLKVGCQDDSSIVSESAPMEQGVPSVTSSWTTSYYSGSEKPQLESIKTPDSYSGNLISAPVQDSNYSDNFNASYTWGVQPQLKSQTLPQPQFVEQSNITFETQKATKFCLIGYPLGHSLSTYIHKAGFKSLGLDFTYEILETPPDSLVDRIKFLKSNDFAGFNVTIPLKLPVTLFLDEVDSSADVVGAVNTIVINPDKTLKGYNTDVIGFRNAIPGDIILAGKTAGVLGTGGAARAAITALAQSQVNKIKVFTRNIPNCVELMSFLRAKFPLVEFEVYQIERIRDLSDIHILVNTTPIGMQGRAADFTPVEENELRTLPTGALVYDVIYNPKKTVLLKLAEKNGYRTINGVDMFIHQAVAAEEIWTGRTPDFKDMKIAALENL